MRFRWCLWGRPDLQVQDAEKVAKGNCLLLSSLRILEAIAPRGPVTLEHPADPGCSPYPSIFLTPEVQDWERRVGAVRVTFPQCQWGCPALKETTLTGTAHGMQRLEKPCNHKTHAASLCGKDDAGYFRSRMAQAYPSELCEMMATIHVESMIQAKERREVRLAQREVQKMIDEIRARRAIRPLRARRGDGDWNLPPSFEREPG